jgi:membrane protein YqaA with SNARE-associated domain
MENSNQAQNEINLESLKNSKQDRIKKWLIKNIDKPIAEKILYFISFIDSFLSPVPPDPFLAGMTALKPKKWLRYAIFTTLFGLLGGLVGYIIGFALFEYVGDYVVELYNLHDELQSLGQTFEENAFLAIFIAAFTPIPYQIFTVSAGLFSINLFIFTTASIIGRGLRFFIVALVMRYIGEHFGKLILKYFNWLLFFGGLIVIVYILFF